MTDARGSDDQQATALTAASAPRAGPPPLPAAEPDRAIPEPPAEVEPASEQADGDEWIRTFIAAAISAIVHLTILLALALWPLYGVGFNKQGPLEWSVALESEALDPLEGDPALRDASRLDAISPESLLADMEAALSPSVSKTHDADPIDADLPDAPLRMVLPTAEFGLSATELSDLGRPVSGKSGGGAPSAASEAAMARQAMAGIAEATDVGGAIDRIARGVLGDLQAEEVLVVWLFDGSLSLVPHRATAATRIAQMVSEAEAIEAEASHRLINAAAVYGSGVAELVRPTAMGQRIAAALVDAPAGTTGVENTFSAVQWAVGRYAKRPDRKVRIVVWTDESGDDFLKLESVIDLCRENHVSVSVVGPSAVLGSPMGVQAWPIPELGQMMYLPVRRGPDSALPERMPLPYWHRSNPWFRNGEAVPVEQLAIRPSWEVGDQFQFMVSGFGPYALTRLALATGGTYTMLDNAADRGPFRFEDVKPYVPDYRSIPEVMDELRYHPLRQAVLAAVAVMADDPAAVPPLAFGPYHVTANQFRISMTRRLKGAAAGAEQGILSVEKALLPMGPDGMESLYASETSPRWQAWYDLTRGRLLAALVRYREYIATCQAIQQEWTAPNNLITLLPAAVVKSGPETAQLAAEAERLLTRCIDDHPGTSWALLAQRELDAPLGLVFYQQYVPPPPPRPAAGGGGRPSFSVPSL